MARPKKQESESRKNRTVRYTDAEWEYLAEQGSKADISASEFARETSLGSRVTLSFGPKPADPALITELNRLSLQLSGLGNLANQIALYAHTDRRIPDAYVALPHEIRETQSQVSQTLEYLVKSHAS